MRTTLLALVYLAAAIIAPAWEPVRLVPYPQKFRTFYSLEDASVPKALREEPAKLDVTNRCGYVWRATPEGLWKLDPRAAARDRSQYFAGQRYLPDNEVVALAPDQDCGIWARTKSGVSHIELRPMALAAKARLFEERIALRHDRYGLVADSSLLKPGDTNSNQYSDSDNDGLWTSIYAAAECFRYSVTKSPEALKRAKHSIEAMLFLEEVAGRRGFPARSYIRKGDRMPHGGEWHWTADGQYYWKADTSSDEIVGHFFIFSIAYDLLPDKELKKRIAQTAGRIMDHILDHNYTLCDLDGKPTTWGWWSPEKLAQEPDERALNSLQLLSFLKTAGHITGNKRYEKEYQKAVTEFKYPDLMKGLNTYRTEMNYSDEELAMLPFYCLFQYEKDAKLLTSYRQALDEWWKNIQREANPLWTFIYLRGQPKAPIDLADAVWTLYRSPVDTIKWAVHNSHRSDITFANVKDRFGKKEAETLLPPDERQVMRWNSNPFIIDGHGNGTEEDDGAAFLLPYWMGRHHKFLLGE